MRLLSKLLIFLVVCAYSAQVLPAQSSRDEQLASLADTGQRALATGRFSEARVSFEQLAKLSPGVAEVHATLAAIYFKLREYGLSVREIREAQKLKPGLPKLDSLLGLSLAELNAFQDALPHLEKGFRQTADLEVRRMCGLQLLRAYMNLQRDSDAVETGLSLNKLYPDDPEVLYHTGRVYGNYAYIVMEKLHDKAPNSVWMLQAQGEANESQKNYDSALISFQHILEIEPRRPGIHYRMGRTYLSRYRDFRKDEDQLAAKREFGAELELDSSNGNAAYELARMAAEGNDLAGAQKQYEVLVARFPDFEQALVGLGGVYLQLNAGKQAIVPLRRATELDQSDEVAWYRLAQAERSASDRSAAQEALGRFRALHAAAPQQRAFEEGDITRQTIDATASSQP